MKLADKKSKIFAASYKQIQLHLTWIYTWILSGSGRGFEGISRSGSDLGGSDSMSVSYIISLLQRKSPYLSV